MAVTAPPRARKDIDRQRRYDRDREGRTDALRARMRGVLEADEARAAAECGADHAFRQSLVDLASLCEEIVDELPAPG